MPNTFFVSSLEDDEWRSYLRERPHIWHVPVDSEYNSSQTGQKQKERN